MLPTNSRINNKVNLHQGADDKGCVLNFFESEFEHNFIYFPLHEVFLGF